MDVSLLPKDFEYGSAQQYRFISTSSISVICDRYNNSFDFFCRSKSADKFLKVIKNVLEILQEKGQVYSYINPKNSRLLFLPENSPVVNEEPKTDGTENMNENIVDEKVDQVKEDIPVSNALVEKYKLHIRYSRLMKSAIDRNLDFNLDISDVKDLLDAKTCFYTGTEFVHGNDLFTMTVDRVQSNKGYVKGNVVACTQQANQLKNSLYEQTNALFKDIGALKRFVDMMFLAQSEQPNLLADLLIHENV